MLEGGQWRGSGATIVAGDQHHVRVSLGHAGRDRPHTHLGHQLNADARFGVGIFEVVDQLCQILDRVDVVVGRR